ncbi:helix-turn-helix transcriptional regulator [Myceligenerans salitolerans]|uniref:Helix-turn-helix transcriptional regulator n=2 Tax=Myceligenerans salitolerans TaxID=1230528 RepID=A0ABS3I7S8_9MICO|nr:helix-turn-helix transcriptional regulator [Myceligenerans salitolerans]
MSSDAVEHVVTTGLLTVQRHNYTDALTGRTRSLGPQQVRRAVELIEERPDAVSSIAELARDVGASARALQAGFRRYLDSTPGEYLRSARLKRARADLRGGAASVSEVAARWGYSNIGRFAAEYRNRYGERPGETLKHAHART